MNFALRKPKYPVVSKRLIVAETATSTWNYHLRLVEPGKEMYGGGAGDAICGAKLGWDTKIPVESYGKVRDRLFRWCDACLVDKEKYD